MSFTFKPCCDAFIKANTDGSDNHCYGKAIWFNIYDGEFSIGVVSDNIKFCPFCGEKVTVIED